MLTLSQCPKGIEGMIQPFPIYGLFWLEWNINLGKTKQPPKDKQKIKQHSLRLFRHVVTYIPYIIGWLNLG